MFIRLFFEMHLLLDVMKNLKKNTIILHCKIHRNSLCARLLKKIEVHS